MEKAREYAESWIKNFESGKDVYRTRYLDPFLKEIIRMQKRDAKILDVGCGWGEIIPFLKPKQKYTGVDPNKWFLRYIKKKFKNNYIVKIGGLPNLKVKNRNFDLVICSMVFHKLKNIDKAVKELFEKTKNNGRLCIIDSSDRHRKNIGDFFDKNGKKAKTSISGTYKLPSGATITDRFYFHTEKEMGSEIRKYGKFNKKYLGPLFVAYTCQKK